MHYFSFISNYHLLVCDIILAHLPFRGESIIFKPRCIQVFHSTQHIYIKTQALFCRNASWQKKITVSVLVRNIRRSNKQRKVNKDLEKHIWRTEGCVLEFITYSPVWMEFQSQNVNTALMFDDHVKCGNLCWARFGYSGNSCKISNLNFNLCRFFILFLQICSYSVYYDYIIFCVHYEVWVIWIPRSESSHS